MEDTAYYKDGVARVLDLMRDTFGDYFKSYYNGQPEELAQSLLPCLMVSETSGTVETGPSGADFITETILIILAMNRKDDISASPDIQMTEFKLRKLIKGQYPAGETNQGEYLPNTVMYALRKHITMSDAVLESTIQTDFDIAQRGEDTFTQEAYVTVSIKRMAVVQGLRD